MCETITVNMGGLTNQFCIVGSFSNHSVIEDVQQTITLSISTKTVSGFTGAIMSDSIIGGKRLRIWVGDIIIQNKKYKFTQLEGELKQYQLMAHDLIRLWIAHTCPGSAAVAVLTIPQTTLPANRPKSITSVPPQDATGFLLFTDHFAA